MPETRKLVAGRYRLAGQIGSGGMGRVWLARDEVLHRDVAVKEVVLPTDLAAAERQDLIDGTLREARAAGRLSHPNVIQVYDVVMFEDRPWIVMEYVPSRSLYEVIRTDGPLAPRRVAEIGLLVLAALQAAHKAKVWHRDVKPGNVLLAKDGRVVLTDFGLATFDGDGGVTRSGLILGSAQYISPERARDGASGPESDMWSLGATLYAAVEGRSPYARESSMATLTALATAPPDTPRRAGPLRPLLMGLLRKNPRHRLKAADADKLLRAVASGEVKGRVKPPHQRSGAPVPEPSSAEGSPAGVTAAAPGEVARSAAFTHAAESGTATQETYSYGRPRRRRWLVAVGAVVVLGVIAAGVVYALDHERRTSPPATGPSLSPTRVLTPEMGIAACAGAPPGSGTPVTGVNRLPGVTYAVLPGWVYYQDRRGFHVAVPSEFRVWQLGPVTCFQEPRGRSAAAVIAVGVRSGTSAELMDEYEGAWTRAAGIHDYKRLNTIAQTYGDSDSTQVEYTYSADGNQLHGANLLLRAKGQVYMICWVGAEYAWSSDSNMWLAFQPSFALDS